MAEYREVIHRRLYLKEPRSERLRKTAAGHLKHLLDTGWKETDRWYSNDYITVCMERSGHAPRMTRLPKVVPPPPRPPRNRLGQGAGSGPRQ